jgi:PAS domain S-box-containing protein
VFIQSLRTRLRIAIAGSLVVGMLAVIAGAGHLMQLQARGANLSAGDFRRDVWATLLLVTIIANVAGLMVVILSTRALDRGVSQVRDAIRSLTTHLDHHPAPAPHGVPSELQPLHDAVDAARIGLQAVLTRERLERERNHAIIDTVFASVFAVDGGGRIIHANAAAARMFDRPMHALTGVVLSDMIATESLQMSVDECGTVTFHADATGDRFTTTIRVFGRRAFPADVSVTPLPLEGQRAWAVFVHDLSAKHHAELELHAARLAADEASRAKTVFLARIGGELRNPLDAAIGFTQVVLRSRSSQLSERDRGYLERVQEAGRHLLALITDILDLSQIEAGTIAFDVADTDVTAMVQSLVTQFESQVAGRPVLLETDLPDIAVYASVDELRLRQVLTNLVSNAVKFTARGSVKITVCTRGSGNQATAVIVRDTGIGIPLDRQAHLFDLLAQTDRDAGNCYHGSGLGLALSKRLASEMGCMLSVESMPGAGSSFTLAFAPAVPVSAPVTHHLASHTG